MRKTLEQFNQLINDLLKDEAQRPVADHIPSEELYQTLDLSLNKDGISDEEFEKILKDIVFKTPRTATTGFFNQLFGGRNEKAVLGDLLAVTLNNSMYTYKAAGPQIGVEKVILREVCNIIGWDSNSDGAFAPGGSMTNYMSMVMARDAFDAEIRHKGSNQKMTVYTSAESHYSIPKNAAFSGIGRDNVRYISTDEFGKIKIGELIIQVEEDVANGFTPIMVNLTAGTTVLGAFDSIPEVREICDANNMWLHVDGAYCGAVLFSQK